MIPSDDDVADARAFLHRWLPALDGEHFAEMSRVARDYSEADLVQLERDTARVLLESLPDFGPEITAEIARCAIVVARAEVGHGATH